MDAYDVLNQAQLSGQLEAYSLRQLLFLKEAPCDIYGISDELFIKILHKGHALDKHLLRDLIDRGHTQIFISYQDKQAFILAQQDQLRRVTRSLSIGNPKENGRNQMNLMTVHMEFLYQDPSNNDLLNLQFQSAKNLASFLLQNYELHVPLYNSYMKQKHHFIFAQPMISSLFLIGLLRQSKSFNQREMENLFLTSYLKDIGMSAIPTDKYDQQELSLKEKELFTRHPQHSIEILAGRTSLGPTYMKMIENHHSFSILQQEIDQEDFDDNQQAVMITGVESLFMSASDVIAAMITGRPYQAATTLFEALDFIKSYIANEHPQEFKIMVSYFKNFNT